MFCRFGSVDESRPVAAPVCPKLVWMRPVPELARYGTPLAGLWLCGPGLHPGAGITGAAGFNCAKGILAG